MQEIPIIIESDVDYDRLEAVFNKLPSKGKENLSPAEKKLFEALKELLNDRKASLEEN